MNTNVIFRIYSPENEELRAHYDPIDTEPRAALRTVEAVISDSKENAIDREGVKIQLAPPKQDADLKRLMKPAVDELIGETKSALLAMRRRK